LLVYSPSEDLAAILRKGYDLRGKLIRGLNFRVD